MMLFYHPTLYIQDVCKDTAHVAIQTRKYTYQPSKVAFSSQTILMILKELVNKRNLYSSTVF